jgi:hypothetical protein
MKPGVSATGLLDISPRCFYIVLFAVSFDLFVLSDVEQPWSCALSDTPMHTHTGMYHRTTTPPQAPRSNSLLPAFHTINAFLRSFDGKRLFSSRHGRLTVGALSALPHPLAFLHSLPHR